jgi:copper chaperone CopZ
MCEVTIEKAARLEGVESADWDADTKELLLKYDPKKVTPEAVQKAIAAEGYDTEAFRGDNKAYSDLPQCCQYPRKK